MRGFSMRARRGRTERRRAVWIFAVGTVSSPEFHKGECGLQRIKVENTDTKQGLTLGAHFMEDVAGVCQDTFGC